MMVLRQGVSPAVIAAVHEASLAEWRALGMQPNLGRTGTYLLGCEWVVAWWDAERCVGAIAGTPAGAHMAFRPCAHGRWFSRRTMRNFLQWYFSHYKLLVVSKWNTKGERVLRKLGFQFEPGRAWLDAELAAPWMEMRA